MKYEVVQTLVRERVVHVTAGSKKEALASAQAGYGEVVSNPRAPLRLLCADATPIREAA